MIDTNLRNASLRQMLCDWRGQTKEDVDNRVRHGRAHRGNDGRDDVDRANAGAQAEMEFAVLDMRATMLKRIDQALARLDAGDYGRCSECAGEIAEQRLRALPFAARCRSCEQQREQEQGRLRQLAQGGGLALFSNATGS